MGESAGECADDLDIDALCGSAENLRAAGVEAELKIAGDQRADGQGAIANEDRLDVDAILGEDALLFGDPLRRHSRIVCGVSDDDFGQRSRAKAVNAPVREEPDADRYEPCACQFHAGILTFFCHFTP
jgi:hypothetical protein